MKIEDDIRTSEQTSSKILIVDDKPENLFVMESILKKSDAQIFKASNGNEALSLLLRHDFALAILDVHMPEMDGFELAELMRSNEGSRHIPIIFVTAISKTDYHIFKGYSAGAVDYLFKPLDSEILKQKVNVFLIMDRQKRLLEESASELKKAKSEAGQAKSEFLARMSHEIRTPMNSHHRYELSCHADRTDVPFQTLAGIDTNSGLIRVGGDHSVYRKLLLKFAKNHEDTMQQVRHCFKSGNMEQIGRIVHTIKGVAGNIGANELHKTAHLLQTGIKDTKNSVISSLLDSFSENLQQVFKSIKNLEKTEAVFSKTLPAVDHVFNRSDALHIIDRIAALLEEDDMAASEHLDLLDSHLKNTGMDEELKAIAEHIGQYDFTNALNLLDKIRLKINEMKRGNDERRQK
ncbi:response regulator [Desulfobacterales bacterium HSG16]|nr:response regulator [Desulfobacterales bacterium HSG16]